MGKSKSGTQLIASVGLLLVPILMLGWLFVKQSNQEISFANRELGGLHYLRAVMPVVKAMALGEDKIATADLAAFESARLTHDSAMDSAELSAKLAAQIKTMAEDPSSGAKAAQDLISRVGDKSNLILDPDLDTYYLMDIVVLRMPQVFTDTSKLHGLIKESSSHDREWHGLQTIYGSVRQLLQNYAGISNAMARAGANSKDSALKLRLANQLSASLAQSEAVIGEMESLINVRQNLEIQATASRAGLAQNHFKIWQGAATELESLLKTRVEILQSRLYLGAGISIVVTLLAILLAIGVLRRLVNKLDDHIVFLAHHDPMTRLKNRAAFSHDMEKAIAAAEKTGELMAFHVVDCDNFKHVNDTYGHQAGDAVLQHIAQSLIKGTRPHDVVGRFGGDEFVILQRNLSKPEDATVSASRLVEMMRVAMPYKETQISTGISIGNAIYPHHAATAEALMQYADASLLSAKELGRNRAVTFSHELAEVLTKQSELERDVKSGLAEDRFFLHFQPQFTGNGSKLVGFEALLRLRSANNSVIAPNVFIPIAERTGLISEIGTWVLRKAIQTASLWPQDLALAVNLSPLQFKPGNLDAIIAKELRDSGFAPARLQAEITENILLDDSETIRSQIQKIRDLGVQIVMDDFGTGFSSLSYLWRFRFDKIKIDRSFMKALDSDPSGAVNILRSIVTLGHSLAMKVVAEGIETCSQADVINSIKCDEVQGFLYGKPLAEQDVAALILNKFREQLQPLPQVSESLVATKAS